MASISSELKTYLKTKSAITSVVGSGTAARIYEDAAREGVSLPYIVYEVIPGESIEYLGGITGIAVNRVILGCYAATREASYTLGESVRLILQVIGKDGTRPTFGSTVVHGITTTGGWDFGWEPPVKGGAQKRYFTERDYFITYAEAVSA